MAEHLVLHFETFGGRPPDTVVTAQALIDWVDLVQATVAAIDASQRLEFAIIGVERGSTRFPQIVKFLDEQTGRIKSAWDEYPHLKGIVVGSAHTLITATVAAGVALAMQPDELVVSLSDQDRALLTRAQSSPIVQQTSRRFYKTLEKDRAISGIGVADDWKKKPAIIIPREEFAERSGLWVVGNEDPKIQTHSDIWDVILLRPALVSTPQSWQFSRDGLKFSANMHDALFLEAIKDGRVPLTLQEGVMMRVVVEYKEELRGQVWEPVAGSRRIIRVISPSVRD